MRTAEPRRARTASTAAFIHHKVVPAVNDPTATLLLEPTERVRGGTDQISTGSERRSGRRTLREGGVTRRRDIQASHNIIKRGFRHA